MEPIDKSRFFTSFRMTLLRLRAITTQPLEGEEIFLCTLTALSNFASPDWE